MSEVAAVGTRDPGCLAVEALPSTEFGCAEHAFALSDLDLRWRPHISFEPDGREFVDPPFSGFGLASLDTAASSDEDIIVCGDPHYGVQIVIGDGAVVRRAQTKHRRPFVGKR
jgi:hypothetical protein